MQDALAWVSPFFATIALGFTAVGAYSWGKLTKKLDAKTPESRKAVVDNVADLEIHEENLELSSQKIRYVYSRASSVDAMEELARQIHSYSSSIWTKIEALFLITLMFILCSVGIALGMLFVIEADGRTGARLIYWYLLLFFGIFILVYSSAIFSRNYRKHKASVDGLTYHLLRTTEAGALDEIIDRAMKGQAFFEVSNRILFQYRPQTNLDLDFFSEDSGAGPLLSEGLDGATEFSN